MDGHDLIILETCFIFLPLEEREDEQSFIQFHIYIISRCIPNIFAFLEPYTNDIKQRLQRYAVTTKVSAWGDIFQYYCNISLDSAVLLYLWHALIFEKLIFASYLC
jgi:hypothetical protein